MKIDAVIVAGGTGSRVGLYPPKQYQKLCNHCVVEETIKRFLNHEEISECVVVIAKDHQKLFQESVSPEIIELIHTTFGGNSRTESVFCGLEYLTKLSSTHVLIHDAARPFVSNQLISSSIKTLRQFDGVVPSLPLLNALWSNDGEFLTKNHPTNDICMVQTPQGFQFQMIYDAYSKRKGNTPDCAAIALEEGILVKLINGDFVNIKITNQEDLEFARKQMNQTLDIRSGQGVDVHAFGPGNSLILCGVEIPFEKSLVGHSDADVGLHAIVDAIYGALGLGDIGTWFPPEEAKWKDADSSRFVVHAKEQLQSKGFQITSLDCTFVCEKPKIKRYQEEMKNRVAELLALTVDRINIKATTSEKLGFMGREEGILALANVTIVSHSGELTER